MQTLRVHRRPAVLAARVAVRATAAISIVVAATVALSCADGTTRRAAVVEPAAVDAAPPTAPATPADPDGHDGHDGPVGPTNSSVGSALDGQATVGTSPHDDGSSELRALVQATLDRYDAALTTVAADPLSAAPGHPSLAEWEAAVVAGGSFSTAMLAEMAERATNEHTVVVPDGVGPSYRHHALRAVRDGTAVSFTWCGHSPGLGIDTVTREVVDDAVALSRGTGELLHDGSVWRVLTLDMFDLDVAAPRTPDPCPARVAAAAAGSAAAGEEHAP